MRAPSPFCAQPQTRRVLYTTAPLGRLVLERTVRQPRRPTAGPHRRTLRNTTAPFGRTVRWRTTLHAACSIMDWVAPGARAIGVAA